MSQRDEAGSHTPLTKEVVKTAFRHHLEWLAATGLYMLEQGTHTYRPADLLNGTDVETSRLKADSTLALYERSGHPPRGTIVGYLEIEYRSSIAQGLFGTDAGMQRERFVVRYEPEQSSEATDDGQ